MKPTRVVEAWAVVREDRPDKIAVQLARSMFVIAASEQDARDNACGDERVVPVTITFSAPPRPRARGKRKEAR